MVVVAVVRATEAVVVSVVVVAVLGGTVSIVESLSFLLSGFEGGCCGLVVVALGLVVATVAVVAVVVAVVSRICLVAMGEVLKTRTDAEVEVACLSWEEGMRKAVVVVLEAWVLTRICCLGGTLTRVADLSAAEVNTNCCLACGLINVVAVVVVAVIVVDEVAVVLGVSKSLRRVGMGEVKDSWMGLFTGDPGVVKNNF